MGRRLSYWAAQTRERVALPLSWIWAARAQTGKGALAQIKEILALRAGGLGPREYYRYRLFDDSRFTAAEKREYTGQRFEDGVYREVNDPGLMARSGLSGNWGGSVDKVLFDSLMRAGAVPTPKLLAIFDKHGPQYFDVPSLRSVSELEGFFRSQPGSAFFIKPARAHSGTGALSVAQIEGDRALMADGETYSLGELAERIAVHLRVVIQERLSPHPVIAAVCGPTVATLRVVVLRRDDSSEIHRAVMRLPVGKNVVDNFDDGQTGNLVGWVDPATGELMRVYGGRGLGQQRLSTHPDSGASFEGLMLPDWHKATATIQNASRVLVGMPFQSWDLALTNQGPVIVEVNDVSDQNILQLAGPPGVLDRRLCDFLRENKLRWRYPYPASSAPGGPNSL